MKEFSIEIPQINNNYPVFIDGDLVPFSIGDIIEKISHNTGKICIVTDEKINTLYFDSLSLSLDDTNLDFHQDFNQYPHSQGNYENFLEHINKTPFSFDLPQGLFEKGYEIILCVIPSGDENKSMENAQYILSLLEENQFSRSDAILAIGGGMIGDLSGFTASIYKRGLKLFQIPTTLLSMIDSCLGGKTAVNFGNSKNSIGTFYNAHGVFINPKFLKSMNPREIYQSLSEGIKYSILENNFHKLDESYTIFSIIKNLIEKLQLSENTLKENGPVGFLPFDEDTLLFLEVLIYQCLAVKKAFIEKDPFDISIRMALNLGHTVGHAIESLSHYKISHGEAVMIGISKMLQVSYHHNFISNEYFEKYASLINKLQKNLNIPYSQNEILKKIYQDKKIIGDKINIILPHEKDGFMQISKGLDEISSFLLLDYDLEDL